MDKNLFGSSPVFSLKCLETVGLLHKESSVSKRICIHICWGLSVDCRHCLSVCRERSASDSGLGVVVAREVEQGGGGRLGGG